MQAADLFNLEMVRTLPFIRYAPPRAFPWREVPDTRGIYFVLVDGPFPLWIGHSMQLPRRLRQHVGRRHRQDFGRRLWLKDWLKDWLEGYTSIDFHYACFPGVEYDPLRHLERTLIQYHQPIHNGAPSKVYRGCLSVLPAYYCLLDIPVALVVAGREE